ILCPHLFSHLELPSFPTRRSSDLPNRQVLWFSYWQNERKVCIVNALSSIEIGLMIYEWAPSSMHLSLSKGFTEVERDKCMELGRSEEHTSELQSLRHLVCRLLLEK